MSLLIPQRRTSESSSSSYTPTPCWPHGDNQQGFFLGQRLSATRRIRTIHATMSLATLIMLALHLR